MHSRSRGSAEIDHDPAPLVLHPERRPGVPVLSHQAPTAFSWKTTPVFLPCLDLWQKWTNRILSDDLGRCFPSQYQHFLPISVDVKLSRAHNSGQLRILQDGCPYRMIDSLFLKELPLKMGAHICGIDRFHIHFIGAKIGIFPFVSKPGIPSPVCLAERFGLCQIVLNLVDLDAIAIPVCAHLREYVLNGYNC